MSSWLVQAEKWLDDMKYEACELGRLRHGDLLQMTAVGGGLTWGSALFRWADQS